MDAPPRIKTNKKEPAMTDGYQICPRCSKQTLPKLREASQVQAVACQNPECKAVIERKELESGDNPLQS